MINNRELATIHRVRPPWLEDLITFYQGRIARQFVLHFNLIDFVIDLDERQELSRGRYSRGGNVIESSDQLLTLREYLHRFLLEEFRCNAIYTYSLAGGLLIKDGKQDATAAPLESGRGQAWQRVHEALSALRLEAPRPAGQPTEGQELNLPDSLSDNFKLLGHLLRQKHYQQARPVANDRETPVAVILDYAEKLIPYHLGEGHGDREQLQALEVVQRWALDPLIRQTNNIVILLTDNIGQIPNSVYAEGSGCPAIRIPLPNEGEREAFICFKMTRARPKLVNLHRADFGMTTEIQAHRLARATQGMRLLDIDNISRRVIIEYRKRHRNNPSFIPGSEVMRTDDVQRAKGEVIQAQSAQLLEVVPPVRGFNEIGGLDKLKGYLEKRAKLMLNGDHSPLVPSGLLLAGPPGTGKTIIAEAMASESGFNLVKMRNIQDKWIGSSERNLEMVLGLLEDLHPVVVFIDEIDQAMGRRDTGQNGDSGVSARMFGRILEAMSDSSTRGRILWVAATNRADLLDEALLRRFDRVIPLLTPDIEESCRIFAAMPRAIAKQGGTGFSISYGGDLQQSEARDKNGRSQPTAEDLARFRPVAEITYKLGLTGAGIEIVIRRAIELAYEEALDQPRPDHESIPLPHIELHHLQAAIQDFKPNHNRFSYDYQSLLAIRACNFRSVIPNLPDSGSFARITGADGQIEPEKLDEEIIRLRQSLPISAR